MTGTRHTQTGQTAGQTRLTAVPDAVVHVSDTQPVNPTEGMLWFNTSRAGSPNVGRLSHVTTTTDITLTASNEVVYCDATSGAITVTLPAAASNSGRRYYIKKIDVSANAVTIDGNGSETIDETTTKVLASQYDSATIHTDGTEWWVL